MMYGFISYEVYFLKWRTSTTPGEYWSYSEYNVCGYWYYSLWNDVERVPLDVLVLGMHLALLAMSTPIKLLRTNENHFKQFKIKIYFLEINSAWSIISFKLFFSLKFSSPWSLKMLQYFISKSARRDVGGLTCQSQFHCLNNSLAQVSTATLFAQVFLVKLVFGSRQDTNPIILWYCTGGAPAPDPARAHTKWKPNTFPFSLLKTFSNFWFCGVKVGAESVTNVILSRSLN